MCSVSSHGVLPCLFRGALGNEGVCSVGFLEETLFLFLGRWYREWEEKASRSMEFELCSLHVTPSNRPTVVFGYIEVAFERYDPNIYRFIHT
jgi:hypothetical protein